MKEIILKIVEKLDGDDISFGIIISMILLSIGAIFIIGKLLGVE